MPIPGSILNDTYLFTFNTVQPFFPSVATLRPVTKTVDTTGQETHTFADSSDSNYQNIPCRRAPLILVRVQEQERDKPNVEGFRARFQINLNKYISVVPEILSQWQVKVDGLLYQIESVESDGNNKMTRLLVIDATPYGV